MSAKLKISLFLAIAAALALAGLAWWFSRPAIPSSIRRQASFLIYYPGRSAAARPNRRSLAYDQHSAILTYSASLGDAQLTITNQASPSNFSDLPQLFDKLIAGMNNYATLDVALGKAYLTRPDKLGSGQVAVVNANGTLMFVHSDRDLSDDQWRGFLNGLEQVK